VRNIRKITKTMQMIATAKFEKSRRRTIATKPYSLKVRELVRELASSVGNVDHPLLRRPGEKERKNHIAVLVITSNRGLAGAYNGNVLRMAMQFIRQQESAGKSIELYVTGKKGITTFNFQKRAIAKRVDVSDNPKFAEVEPQANEFIADFIAGKFDSVHVAYMNFHSAGSQKPDVMTLSAAGRRGFPAPAPAGKSAAPVAQAPARRSTPSTNSRRPAGPAGRTAAAHGAHGPVPGLPRRDDKRACRPHDFNAKRDRQRRQDGQEPDHAIQPRPAKQITTELSEIMGGVEAMKG